MNYSKLFMCLIIAFICTSTINAQVKSYESLPLAIENIESGKFTIKASKDHPFQYDVRVRNGKIDKLVIKDKYKKKVKTKPTNMQFVAPMCLTTQPVACTTVIHGDGSEHVACWCGDRIVWRLPDEN